MNPIQECYSLTKELMDYLGESKEIERDDLIKKVEQFLDQRELLVQSIKPPFTKEDQLLGDRLILLSKQLDVQLINIKKDIQKDINGMNKKKKSMNQYTNPYANLQSDGFFYDKRK